MAMLMKGLVSHTERVRIHNESHAKQSPLGAVANHYKPQTKKPKEGGKTKIFEDDCELAGGCNRHAFHAYTLGQNYVANLKSGNAKEMQIVLKLMEQLGVTKTNKHFLAGMGKDN